MDTIDRKAAIDAIVNTVSRVGMHDNSEVARYGATFRQHEIIDIIETLPSTPRWIPIGERLPKLDEDVLLCYIEYDRWHGQYVSVGQGKRFTFEWVEEGEDENEVEWEWVFANDLVHLVEVKYWMPLPEPQKGE